MLDLVGEWHPEKYDLKDDWWVFFNSVVVGPLSKVAYLGGVDERVVIGPTKEGNNQWNWR